MSAASATRRNTTVNGGNSLKTTPLKKNDPPHRIESRPSSDQSRASIEVSVAVIAVHICEHADLFHRAGLSHPVPGRDYFGRDTISIILPSSSSGILAFARA